MSTALLLVAPLVSAALLWLAFPPAQLGWVAWVALVPLSRATIHCRSSWAALWIGAVFGGAWIMGSLDWVRTAYPRGGSAGGPLLAIWLALGVCGALSAAISTCMLRGLVRNFRWPVAVALPLTWAIGEEGRDVLCRSLGGTTADIVGLALSQAGHLALQVADLGGTAAVAWLVATGNGCVVDLLDGRWRSSARAIIGASGASVALAFGYCALRLPSSPSQTVLVRLVPGDLHESVPRDLDGPRRVRLAVWPEGAFSQPLCVPSDEVPRELESATRSMGCPILVGCDRISLVSGRIYNSAILATSPGTCIGFTDKRFLSPIVESRTRFTDAVLGHRTVLMHPYTAGTATAALELPDGLKIGVGICHDVCYPEWGSPLCRGGAEILVNLASEGFDASRCADLFLLACAQVRAVECRRAVVKCARRGCSAVIDGSGQIVGRRCGEHCGEAVDLAVPLDVRFSPFVVYGRAPWIAGVILVACITHWTCMRSAASMGRDAEA